MLFVNSYLNLRLINYLQNIPKHEIFKVGRGGGKQTSCIYNYYNIYKLNETVYPFIDLIDINYFNAKKNNLQVKDNFVIENRDYIFEKNDEYFEGDYHMDIVDFSQKPCYTFVYYYKISSTIKGGEVEFENKQIYVPKENDILCFNGDIKHRVNKISGEGIRGTVIMNIEKLS